MLILPFAVDLDVVVLIADGDPAGAIVLPKGEGAYGNTKYLGTVPVDLSAGS